MRSLGLSDLSTEFSTAVSTGRRAFSWPDVGLELTAGAECISGGYSRVAGTFQQQDARGIESAPWWG